VHRGICTSGRVRGSRQRSLRAKEARLARLVLRLRQPPPKQLVAEPDAVGVHNVALTVLREDKIPPEHLPIAQTMAPARIAEEIITALSRFYGLFVIARNFTYKGRSVDVKQVGRELGVRYVLEGSVRRAGQRIRITGQLIDTTNGAHLMGGPF
jgi:hypothetical protein